MELGDDKLPEETLRKCSWLRDGMETHRQAFFHASDAYDLGNIGCRHTWIKLASPRIEALRQAFVARNSRLRIGFEKGSGALRKIDNPPDVQLNEHPWLKEETVSGGVSFFRGMEGGEPRKTRFRFSPDLTCIIGGSMTGKSTLIDGLRLHVGAALPVNEAIRGRSMPEVEPPSAPEPPVSILFVRARTLQRRSTKDGPRNFLLRTSFSAFPKKARPSKTFSHG